MGNKASWSTLKRRSDFQKIQLQGARTRIEPWLVVGYLRNQNKEHRVGWTVPANVGTAVVRNKIKRWTREYFRNKLPLPESNGLDVNLIFHTKNKDFFRSLKHEQLHSALDKAAKKVGF